MLRRFCDKCGKEIIDIPNQIYFTNKHRGTKYTYLTINWNYSEVNRKDLDLCLNCAFGLFEKEFIDMCEDKKCKL